MVVSLFDLFSGFMKIEDSRWRILSETWSFSQRHRWGFHQRVGSQNQQEIGFKGHVSMHKLTHTHNGRKIVEDTSKPCRGVLSVGLVVATPPSHMIYTYIYIIIYIIYIYSIYISYNRRWFVSNITADDYQKKECAIGLCPPEAGRSGRPVNQSSPLRLEIATVDSSVQSVPLEKVHEDDFPTPKMGWGFTDL